MHLTLGLTLALLSAIAVNWAYSREHDAAAAMPRFSPRHPRRFVSLLVGDRLWLVGFGTETAGWLAYVAALRLAPLSLVQAVCASGIAALAFASAHGQPSRLAHHERIAVVVAVAGLVLLALSLVDSTQADHVPGWRPALLWLGASTLGALVLAQVRAGLPRGPALGLAAGLLFAGGDISAKLAVGGGIWLVTVSSLIVCYALGTSILQGAFQHGDALTAAGLATLATNAVPIAAGFVVFGEQLPAGTRGLLQLTAFGSVVVSAVLLARPPHHRTRTPGPAVSRSPNTRTTAAGRRPSVDATFSRIVVGIDGSEAGFDACRQVARLADTDGAIDAVAVVHIDPAVAAALDAAHVDDVLAHEADAALERAVEILGGRAHKRSLDGFVVPALLDELRSFGATLLALGTHGHRRATEIVIGGVAGELLHAAPCSVLIARPSPNRRFPSRIVVGHDGSREADDALAVARLLGERFGSATRVVSALDGEGVDLTCLQRAAGAEPINAQPVRALVDAARDADLLVVGSRGLHGFKALGSVSERVAHDAPCSVLVVREAASAR